MSIKSKIKSKLELSLEAESLLYEAQTVSELDGIFGEQVEKLKQDSNQVADSLENDLEKKIDETLSQMDEYFQAPFQNNKAVFFHKNDIDEFENSKEQLKSLKELKDYEETLIECDNYYGKLRSICDEIAEKESSWCITFVDKGGKSIFTEKILNEIADKEGYTAGFNDHSVDVSSYQRQLESGKIEGRLPLVKAFAQVCDKNNVKYYIATKSVAETAKKEVLTTKFAEESQGAQIMLKEIVSAEKKATWIKRLIFVLTLLVSVGIAFIGFMAYQGYLSYTIIPVSYLGIAGVIFSIVMLKNYSDVYYRDIRAKVTSRILKCHYNAMIKSSRKFVDNLDDLGERLSANAKKIAMICIEYKSNYDKVNAKYESAVAQIFPDGLCHNLRLVDKIILLMGSGQADNYKEARLLASQIISREDYENEQLSLEREKNRQQAELVKSQKRAEAYARESAEEAKRQADYMKKQAEEAKRQAEYAKQQAEYARETESYTRKLTEIEKERLDREKYNY